MSYQDYILLKPSGYYFRYKFPLDIRPLVNKTELRYSLKTRSIDFAKSKARIIAGKIQNLIRNIRTGTMEKLTVEQINRLIRDHITTTLDMDEVQRITDDKPYDPVYQDDHLKILGLIQDGLKHKLATKDLSFVEGEVDKLLENEGYEVDKGSIEYKMMCRDMLKAYTHIYNIQQKREQGDYTDIVIPDFIKQTPLPDKQTQTPEADTKKISQVMNLFFTEGKSTQKWTDKTEKEIKASLNVMLDYFGDISVETLTRSMMSEFKQTVMQLPPNMNKDKQYRDKSIHEIVEMKPKRTIAAHTINKILGRADTLLEHATIHGYMPMNPAKGMKVKLSKRNVEARQIFTPSDLSKLFGSPKYTKDTFRKSYQFWCPILALFTGARVNEIAQLHLSDFQEHDGIWCISINDDNDKTLKNSASKRIIPLHPFLTEDLGIIRRVERLRELQKNRFHHDLPKASGGYGVYVSRWFNERYRNDCDIEKGKSFHSFRHLFGTALSHNGINDHSLKALMGHAEKGTTFDTYVKRGTATKLYADLVKHLDYGLDLEHLKGSRWAE